MGLIVTGRMRFLGDFRGVFPQLPPPTPSFTASPTTGLIPLTVQFTNTTNATGTSVSYQWDFDGDGITDSTEVNPSYTYTNTGTFSVTLTAINTGGSTSTTILNYISPYTIVPANFTGLSIEVIPATLYPSDVNTLVGININDIPATASGDYSVQSMVGININDIPATASVDYSVQSMEGTNNEIPAYLSV